MDRYCARLREEVFRVARADFEAAYGAHLYAEKLPESVKTDFKTQLAGDEQVHFSSSGGTARLIAITKRPGGLFADRISVGRTRKSDIVIVHSKVSKFHGYFERSDGSYHFTDFASTNGTFRNGKRLEPRKPELLADGDRLEFGDVEFQFLLSPSLYNLLRNSDVFGDGD